MENRPAPDAHSPIRNMIRAGPPRQRQSRRRQPYPFFERLYGDLGTASTEERRVELLKCAGNRAVKEYPVALQRLEDLLLKQSPFTVLAAFGFYDLLYLPEVGRRLNEGDPIDQNHIEVIQALVLCHEEGEFERRGFTPQEFQEIRDLVVQVSILQSARQYAQIDSSLSQAEVQRLQYKHLLREHTKSVRNWGYEEQTVRVLTHLYAPMEDEIERILGVRIEFLVQMFRAVVDDGARKLQEHFTKVKSFMREKTVTRMAASYLSQFNDPGVTTEGISGWAKGERNRLREVKATLLHRSISFLLPAFAFELSEFQRFYPRPVSTEKIARLVEAWSCKLGELKQQNRDFLFLNNPVWRRPMMHVAEQIFFWPIMPLFHGFCFEMMESLVLQNSALKERYLKRRGRFLEEYVSELFCKRYPDASIYRGSKWVEPSTGKEGENDLLVVFDSRTPDIGISISCILAGF
jgi:hypothetical protein